MSKDHKENDEKNAAKNKSNPDEQLKKDVKPEELECEKSDKVEAESKKQSKNQKEEKSDLSAKMTELEAECKEWQNQYLRKSADFDNYRKRMLKEKQEAINYANGNLLLDLVKVLDDFDRAIEAGTANSSGEANSSFAEGIVMIKNQMLSMLKTKYGLEHYEAKGEPFDPNFHEAISMIPSDAVKEQTVGEVALKGYKLRDRIIRHAKVVVFMPKEEKAENKTENKDDADKTSINNEEKTANTEKAADEKNN